MMNLFNNKTITNKGEDKIKELITHLSDKHFNNLLVTQFANINGTMRFATDLESNTIIWANEQCKKVFGDDIIGEKCTNIFDGVYHKCDTCFKRSVDLKHETIYVNIDKNNLTGDTYLIRTVIFEVEGKEIMFEEAINITSYIDIIKKI